MANNSSSLRTSKEPRAGQGPPDGALSTWPAEHLADPQRQAVWSRAASISLQQAAEFLGAKIIGQHPRQQHARQELTSGRWLEARPLHLFDPRGCQLALHCPGSARPFLSARAWNGRRFAQLVDFFLYLDRHPEVFVSETRLAQRSSRYHQESGRW